MRLKCTVAYEGSSYCGWQSQKTGDSIQEKIESALENIMQKPVHITASGRTDKGVNAEGQVFHFDTDKEMKESKWQSGINSFLPADIHIVRVEKVNSFFHARYSAYAKTYQYRIHLGGYDVFSRNTAFQCPYVLDISRMIEASQYLIGTHDFTSYNSNTLRETPDQIRTIYAIAIDQTEDCITITYTGNGFLRYMVRMMSAQLMEAGRGRIAPQEVKQILEERSKNTSRRKAHAEGLTLKKVSYFDEIARSGKYLVRTWTEYDEKVPCADIEKSFCIEYSGKKVGVFISEEDEGKLYLYQEKDQESLSDLVSQLEKYENGRPVIVSVRAERSVF